MKKIISILLMLTVSYTTLAQLNNANNSLAIIGDETTEVQKDTVKDVDGEKILSVCEQMPSFQGNVNAWLASNVIYPKEAVDNKIQGRVVVRFVIRKDGTITNATIVRSVDSSLDNEALRCINSMPKWNPGRNNGEPVSVYFNLPITFKL